MTLSRNKTLAALVLLLGLVMAVWGGRSYALVQRPQAHAIDLNEDGASLANDVIGSPTTWETLKALVKGPVGRTIGALLVTGVGLALALGGAACLVERKAPA